MTDQEEIDALWPLPKPKPKMVERSLVARLRACADDPMWADHAEIPKYWCSEAADELERLRAALLDCARRCEALKRPCGMDPESAQAVRNGEYMSIALVARAALGPNVL